MGLETIVAATYAAFLVLVAWVLELFGRITAARADQYETAGFRYREEIDAYECEGGEILPLVELGADGRLGRYEAAGHHCGRCPVKHFCTEDEKNREIVRSNVPWVDTEVGRFHRGLSLILLVLAASILVGVGLRYEHSMTDQAVLGGFLTAVVGRGAVVARGLRA